MLEDGFCKIQVGRLQQSPQIKIQQVKWSLSSIPIVASSIQEAYDGHQINYIQRKALI